MNCSRRIVTKSAIRLGIAVVFLWPDVCQAGLELKFDANEHRVRSHAPVTLNMQLDWDSPKLLEGRLKLRVTDRGLLYEYESHDIALSLGSSRQRIQLPPIILQRVRLDAVIIEAEFTTLDGKTIPLGRYDLPVPPQQRRRFVIAMVSPPERRVDRSSDFPLVQALSIERFHTEPRSGDRGIATAALYRTPRDLPDMSEAYCMYDLVVLTEGCLLSMRRSQLEALGDWVEAGGSLFLSANGVLESHHAEFLNRLSGHTGSERPYVLSESGELRSDLPGVAGPTESFRSGLGRSICVTYPLAGLKPDYESPEWRLHATFLWKFRHEMIPQTVANGVWPHQQRRTGWIAKPDYWHIRPLNLREPLQKLLIPTQVRTIPFSWIVVMLVAFLLTIAPGDWFLLGLLNRRHYTWILFPLVSLSFTAVTVFVAQSHLGARDYRNSLTLIDVVNDRPARTSRIELLFTATSRTATTEHRRELFSALQEDLLTTTYLESGDQQAEPLQIAGRPSSSYTVRRSMRKWTPQLARHTSLGGTDELPGLDWTNIDVSDFDTEDGRMRLQDNITRQMPGAQVLLLHRSDRWLDTELIQSSSSQPGRRQNNRSTAVMQPVTDLVHKISNQTSSGLLAIVAQVAPTGAGLFEDLTMFDPGDPDMWMLIITVRQGDDRFAWRRLYRQN